jgi:hypothetical protein
VVRLTGICSLYAGNAAPNPNAVGIRRQMPGGGCGASVVTGAGWCGLPSGLGRLVRLARQQVDDKGVLPGRLGLDDAPLAQLGQVLEDGRPAQAAHVRQVFDRQRRRPLAPEPVGQPAELGQGAKQGIRQIGMVNLARR